MSFLNPVSEPVLSFSSTDASAPQINYMSRVAGDVKAVLKACLVTGYGAKVGAGWTVESEVGNVTEFNCSSAAVSEYSLGIDDSGTANTTWYYKYQGARVNPDYNVVLKTTSNISANNSNGWRLIVTARGLCFIEFFYMPAISNPMARITYWGQAKSALTEVTTRNISFFSVGFNAPIQRPDFMFGSSASYLHHNIQGNTGLEVVTSNLPALRLYGTYGSSTVELVSPIFLYKGNTFVAEQTGILAKNPNSLETLYGVYETVVDGRQMLHVCSSVSASDTATLRDYAKVLMIYLDYWEY